MSTTDFHKIEFDMHKNKSNVIKVIGVGGGGSNAVNHMFAQGFNDVDFVICNTDAQALKNSSVPNKIQLGVGLTEGLGAGANPEIGKKAAEESAEEIKKMLSTSTKMVFITAGMGGGTGTGAAPVIAKIARELDLLTVGIVTVPFNFEGKSRREQARKGIEEIRKHLDSIIVINNNKLRDVYGNLGFKAGFGKADEVLSTAARGIAEVITDHYTLNIDLKDARTVLANSGTALMGSAIATGEDRAKNAITQALDSPLLDDNRITGAKNVLLLIVSGTEDVTLDEIGEINDFICNEAKIDVNIIMGVGENEELEGALAVTVIATGFNKEQQTQMSETGAKKVIHVLEPNQQATFDFQKEQTLLQKTEKPIENNEILSEEPKAIAPEKSIDISEIKTEEDISNELQPTEEVDKTIENIEDFDITIVSSVEKEEVTKDETTTPNTPLLFDFSISDVISKKSQGDIKSAKEEKEEKPLENTKKIDEKVVYTLSDEYLEMEEKLVSAKAKNVVKESNYENDFDSELTFRVEESTPQNQGLKEEKTSERKKTPFDMGINELKKTANERRETLKNFNYKFSKKISSDRGIEEYERQPAYKRQGMELDNMPPTSAAGKSRTTLSIDEDNDINLRSNNSFLHDNVD